MEKSTINGNKERMGTSKVMVKGDNHLTVPQGRCEGAVM